MEAVPNPSQEKKADSKVFSSDFIKKRIRSLLEAQDAVKEVTSLDVRGSGSEITLDTKVKAQKFFLTVNVGVQAILENKGGAIKVKSYKIDAQEAIKSTVEGMIVPKLNTVSELLKSFIEKEEGKKVSKVEIENGGLKVTFNESRKETPPPAPKPVQEKPKEAPPAKATTPEPVAKKDEEKKPAHNTIAASAPLPKESPAPAESSRQTPVPRSAPAEENKLVRLGKRYWKQALIGIGIGAAGTGLGNYISDKGNAKEKEKASAVSPVQLPRSQGIENNFNPNFSPVMNQVNMNEAVAEKLRQARMEEESRTK